MASRDQVACVFRSASDAALESTTSASASSSLDDDEGYGFANLDDQRRQVLEMLARKLGGRGLAQRQSRCVQHGIADGSHAQSRIVVAKHLGNWVGPDFVEHARRHPKNTRHGFFDCRRRAPPKPRSCVSSASTCSRLTP